MDEVIKKLIGACEKLRHENGVLDSELLLLRQLMQREREKAEEEKKQLKGQVDCLKAELVALRSLHRSESMNANMRESMVVMGKTKAAVVFQNSGSPVGEKIRPSSASKKGISWESEEWEGRQGAGLKRSQDVGAQLEGGGQLAADHAHSDISKTRSPAAPRVLRSPSAPSFTAKTLGDRTVTRGELLARAKQFTASLEHKK